MLRGKGDDRGQGNRGERDCGVYEPRAEIQRKRWEAKWRKRAAAGRYGRWGKAPQNRTSVGAARQWNMGSPIQTRHVRHAKNIYPTCRKWNEVIEGVGCKQQTTYMVSVIRSNTAFGASRS